MSRATEDVIREAYTAFNERDIERAVTLMDPEVDWPDVVQGGFVHGRDGVRQHWREVFASSEPRVQLVDLSRRADHSVAAQIRQTVAGPDGLTISEDRLTHVFQMENGLIKRMDVEASS